MTWGFVGAAAISAVGGAVANNQKNKAAKGAANAMTDAQRQQYDQTRQDLSPYRDFGQSAIPLLSQLNSGDYSGFLNSPDYQFALQQGIGNLDRSAASRGSLFSGGHEKDLSQFSQGLAGQFLGNYRNSLFDQAQMGQQAAGQTGLFGQHAADQIGGAQAGYYQQRGDNNSQLTAGIAGGLGNLFGNYMGQQQGGGGQSSYGYTGLGGSPAFGSGGSSTSPFSAMYGANLNGYGWG